jgi:hypothetical protein
MTSTDDVNEDPGQHGRSLNSSKLIKNGGFTEPRYFSYTDILRTDLRVRLPATVCGPLTNTVYAPF